MKNLTVGRTFSPMDAISCSGELDGVLRMSALMIFTRAHWTLPKLNWLHTPTPAWPMPTVICCI